MLATPHGWSYENVARLLLGCGDAITKGLLSSRARNGRTDELSVLMFHLLRVCGRADIVQRENGKNVRSGSTATDVYDILHLVFCFSLSYDYRE